MNKNNILKRIDNCIDTRRNLWAATVILSGGLAGLFINLNSLPKIILLVLGVVLNFFFINGIIYNSEKIEILLNKIENGE